MGEEPEDKQKRPGAMWPAKEKGPVADVPRRAGGVIRAWPGALQHICRSAVSEFTQHMALGWVCIRTGHSFLAHEKPCFKEIDFIFTGLGGSGGGGSGADESKQK